MKLKDYLFYRMSIINRDTNRSILYLFCMDSIIFSPFFFFIMTSVQFPKWLNITLIAVYIGSLMIINMYVYENKRKIIQVVRKYRNNKYNKIIKNWMIYILPFFIMFLYILIGRTVTDLLK